MNPPMVTALTIPSIHSTNKMTANVINIKTPFEVWTTLFNLRTQTYANAFRSLDSPLDSQSYCLKNSGLPRGHPHQRRCGETNRFDGQRMQPHARAVLGIEAAAFDEI